MANEPQTSEEIFIPFDNPTEILPDVVLFLPASVGLAERQRIAGEVRRSMTRRRAILPEPVNCVDPRQEMELLSAEGRHYLEQLEAQTKVLSELSAAEAARPLVVATATLPPLPTHRLWQRSRIADGDWQPTNRVGLPTDGYEANSFTDYEWRPLDGSPAEES